MCRQNSCLQHRIVDIVLDVLQKIMLRHKIVDIVLYVLQKTARWS